MTKSKISNAIARKYFLHAEDTNGDAEEKCCYFCQSGRHGDPEDGWGIWIDRNGNVDVDSVSANGEMPSARIIAVLRVATRKYLSR
jgi:hypothetical protein